MRLLIFVGLNIGGYLGWRVGEYFGVVSAYAISCAGSLAGVVAGWWVARTFLR